MLTALMLNEAGRHGAAGPIDMVCRFRRDIEMAMPVIIMTFRRRRAAPTLMPRDSADALFHAD